jgi:hypothetical protein
MNQTVVDFLVVLVVFLDVIYKLMLNERIKDLEDRSTPSIADIYTISSKIAEQKILLYHCVGLDSNQNTQKTKQNPRK